MLGLSAKGHFWASWSKIEGRIVIECLANDDVIPAPEQHESAYLFPENAVDGGVVFGI